VVAVVRHRDDDDLIVENVHDLADQAGFLQLLTRLVNRGYWFFG
jgi:50S ribosomal protein L16 3-hydroxylase